MGRGGGTVKDGQGRRDNKVWGRGGGTVKGG
jgi:hypothetical protein